MAGRRRDPWDAYAPFYDWENARTYGRRDVAFWRTRARAEGGAVLELGSGTGRLLLPLARAGIPVSGIDRSAAMLAKARERTRRLPRSRRPAMVSGDVCRLPWPAATFTGVIASYGLLQSLQTDDDLAAALHESARVLRPGGWLGVDLVPDLPAWPAYGPRLQLKGRGPRGGTVSLVESVTQDRRRGLTIFHETFIETVGRRESRTRFTLTFRTLPMTDTLERIEAAGFQLDAVHGNYRGGPWHPTSDAWVILARRSG